MGVQSGSAAPVMLGLRTRASLKGSYELRRRLSGFGRERPAAYKGLVEQLELSIQAAKQCDWRPTLTSTVWLSGQVMVT